MAKINSCIGLDLGMKTQMQMLGVELSSFFNKSMHAYLTQYKANGIDMFAINQELRDLQAKKAELTKREAELVALKLSHEEQMRKKREDEAKKAERMADAIKASGVLADNLR